MAAPGKDPPERGIARGLLGGHNLIGEKHPAFDPGVRSAGSHPMKAVPCLVAASLVAGAFSFYALPRPPGEAISPTRSFSLNGRSYLVGTPAEAGFLLREVLRKRGLTIPELSRVTADPDGGVIDTLSETPSKFRSPPVPLPPGFRAENNLQMESGDRSIDITTGHTSLKNGDARKALVAAGWESTETEEPGRPFRIATLRQGRETTIVLLEKKEGNCLFIRRREK
jgi:hypothetical protein